MKPVNLSNPAWKIHRGQAVWQPRVGAPEVAGQLLLASTGSGEVFIRFSKDPLDIVLARRDSRGWTLDMPAFSKSYSGRGRPPRRIGWFLFADAVFKRTVAPGWDWSGLQEGHWDWGNPRTGERLQGFFNQ